MSARERLVSVGTEMLEEHGLAGISLRSIASSAGVSHGAPRRHFPTYRALLAAIARGGIEALDLEIRPALADSEPRRGIRQAAEAYLDFAAARPEMFALITRHDLLEGAGGELREITACWFADLRQALGRARGDAVSAEDCLALWAGVHGLAALTSRRTTEPVGSPDRDKALSLILDAGFRPHQP
ncbi:TetR/AcrR family transcriptional regulator [Nocardioides alcanivorans]|uniref:TetR/AcrR family transcriptional regulator n=1 Tax=Nocardioides alcanivorans TaxID=2897352 RepID=UPI001F3F87A3|nr:TetR/AcrR family transcriptional regulator [Nocardioides alcanivorans]